MGRKKGTKNKPGNYYAIYKGDEFLLHGPLWELASKLSMKETSVRLLSYKRHHKRAAAAPNPEKWMVAIKVDELTKADLKIKHRKRGK